MPAGPWGEVEMQPEVRAWHRALDEGSRTKVDFYIELLRQEGALLGEPYTRQLDGKLRELRFSLHGQATRITYWIAPRRRIVLLTMFSKTRQRERKQIERAWRAMQQSMAQQQEREVRDE